MEIEYRVKAGRVVAGVEVRVTAEDGTVLPRDGKTVGEFEIRGPWITALLLRRGRPREVPRRLAAHRATSARSTAKGSWSMSDRTKDVIKSGGEWISSVELEVTMMAHPAVFEAAVIAVPDEKWQERPLCCVVLAAGRHGERRGAARVPRRASRQVVAARALDVHRERPEDQRRQVRQEGPARSVRRGRARGRGRRVVESFDDLADEVAALERRVADAIFDAVRAQLARRRRRRPPRSSSGSCRRSGAASKRPSTCRCVTCDESTASRPSSFTRSMTRRRFR